MKKGILLIGILFLLFLSGCNKPAQTDTVEPRHNSVEYHPEFLEQIELAKDKLNSDFLKYIDNSKYSSIIYSNDYFIFSSFGIYQAKHFADSLQASIYGTNNLFAAEWRVMYKQVNKTCWTGRSFILVGSVRGDLYPLKNNDINNLLEDNNLKFNDNYYVYCEDENGYNKNFDCLRYRATVGYANESKSKIMQDYEKVTTYYWDWVYYGITNPTLIKSSN